MSRFPSHTVEGAPEITPAAANDRPVLADGTCVECACPDGACSVQVIKFLKEMSITGAFVMLAANGAGALGLDARKPKQSLGFRRPAVGAILA